MTSPSHDRTPRRVLAAFSGPSLPFSALSLPVVISLPEYYASTVGLPLAIVVNRPAHSASARSSRSVLTCSHL